MTTQPRTGAILLRVSTKQQAEEGKSSYEVQLADCQQYATANAITVQSDLIWQEVGKRDHYYTRDGLQAALTAAREHKYQVLIVWRMDRLTDDPGRLFHIVEELEQCGVTIGYAREPDTNTDTDLGKWLAYTKALFQVKPERTTTALRTSEARRLYTKQGRPWASHSARYGYRWLVNPARTVKRSGVEVPLKERLEPEPETAPVLVQMYQWADQGKTLKWIARALSGQEEGGIHRQPTPRQHAKIGGASQAGRWEPGTVLKMLSFPGYMGRWPAYRSKREKLTGGAEGYRQRILDEREWVWVEPSPAPALVPPALWQRVQKRLSDNKLYSQRNRTAPSGPERALLFGGMARCSLCDGALDSYPKAYERADGAVRYAYRCRRSHRHHADCPGVWHDATSLDYGVWRALVTVLHQPDALRRYAQRQYLHDHPDETGVKVITPLDEQQDAERRLAGCDAKIATWLERMDDPRLDPDNLPVYDMQVTVLREQRKTLAADVARLKKAATEYARIEETIGSWEDYLDMAGGYADFLTSRTFAEWDQAPAIQRRWLEALGARVMVTHDGATLHLHLTRIGPARAGQTAGPDAVAVPIVPSVPPAPRQGAPIGTPLGDAMAATAGMSIAQLGARRAHLNSVALMKRNEAPQISARAKSTVYSRSRTRELPSKDRGRRSRPQHYSAGLSPVAPTRHMAYT